MINSRQYYPQTNGKLERFHHTVEEIEQCDTLPEYVSYYNRRRLYFSLDIKNRQMLKAFSNKIDAKTIKKNNLNRIEEDVNSEAK